ncbi:shikimate dehydrogenase [Arthrobacter sp. NPDC089319]|uniref:shikimate dehydrogenase n=1 Tax=Arthrobacter sp. NPDC089319 TaxID=3155915 RepID=UPI0034444997
MSGHVEPRRRFLVGLIGNGIGTSLSPALHESEAAALGLDYRYQLIDLAGFPNPSLEDVLRYAEAMGYNGFNVTHPYKQAVIPYLDELSEDAAAIGAVNTIVRHPNGRLHGHNTDWVGFAELFARSFRYPDTENVVQLGAGGAGAAVAYAQLKNGVSKLWVLDTEERKARQLAENLNGIFGANRARVVMPADAKELIGRASGLVNTTPIGMKEHPGMPVSIDWFSPGQWLVDIVYMPLVTELLSSARERGIPAVGGAAMTVFQAAEAVRLITGVEPDQERMYAHMQQFLTTRERQPTQ